MKHRQMAYETNNERPTSITSISRQRQFTARPPRHRRTALNIATMRTNALNGNNGQRTTKARDTHAHLPIPNEGTMLRHNAPSFSHRGTNKMSITAQRGVGGVEGGNVMAAGAAEVVSQRNGSTCQTHGGSTVWRMGRGAVNVGVGRSRVRQ